jgi:multiple sugar transport system permease protein
MMTALRSRRGRRALTLAVCYGAIAVFMIFFLFPPYWMAITSFKTNQEIEGLKGIPLIIQEGATLEHYVDLLANSDFLLYFWNSVSVTVPVVLLSMLISVLAAYALSRLGFAGAGVIGTAVFLVYLVPDSLLFIPLFKIIGSIGLLNSKWALVLVYPTLIVPFATWLLIGYFASIPRELDEAALVDGATPYRAFWDIILPLARPALGATAIIGFLTAWNEYEFALVLTSSEKVRTISVAIA